MIEIITCVSSVLGALFAGMAVYNQIFTKPPMAYVDENKRIVVCNVSYAAVVITRLWSENDMIGMTGVDEYGGLSKFEPVPGNSVYLQYKIDGNKTAYLNYALAGNKRFRPIVTRDGVLSRHYFSIHLIAIS